MTLKEELSQFVGKDVVVIMTDGRGYRGKVDKHDDEVTVMKEVYETLNQEVDEKGYMFWRKVLHTRLIINNKMIMRIWPWDAPKVATKQK
ncbi:MAG: hypothetical protein AB1779_10755 [Candidatus Thermoplasmatota archaeon]